VCAARAFIKEDTVAPNLLFLGTEFGLWISLDGGKHWAQYKGHQFPMVAVRDIVVHRASRIWWSPPMAAHLDRGRHTTLRKLTPESWRKRQFSCRQAREQRLPRRRLGGRSAVFTDPIPEAALIRTQRSVTFLEK